MTTGTTSPWTPMLSAKALGAVAVAGVVIAFSLSSTLVKRAESPGVLVAFWGMTGITAVTAIEEPSSAIRMGCRRREANRA
jgi:hypothetical protein